jgi:hypothetical protein
MKTIPIVQLLIGMAIAGSAWAQNPLDDAIYSVKCLGADDKEACKAKARKDFEDYQRQKQGGGASAATIGTTTPTEKCQSVSAKGPVDVDTAYARAIGTFHFQTYEEKTHYGQYKRTTMLDDGYKHVRNPGAIYQLWDRVNLYWPARNKTVYFYGGTTLQKDRGGATVTAEYCLKTTAAEYSDPAFWQFADDSFRSLVQ